MSILNVFCFFLLFSTAQALNVTLFKQLLLDYHNHLRAIHDAPRVVYDPNLDNSAYRWAQHLGTYANNKCLYHSQDGGENIYFIWSTSPVSEHTLARNAMKAFYEEIQFYNYDRPGLIIRAAHFTNLVWKAVQKMGVGVYIQNYENRHGACNVQASPSRPATGYMVVVHLGPAGNIMTSEEFTENVRRPNQVFNF